MLNKKILAAILAIVMIVAIVPCSVIAEDTITITADNVTVDLGAATASVTIKVSGNTGMAMLGFEVDYDSDNFTLESITKHSDVFAESDFDSMNVSRVPFMFTVSNFDTGVSGNGALVTLNFAIKSGCPVGTYPVTIENAEIYTIDEEPVESNLISGSIIVSEPQDEPELFTFNGAAIRTEGVQGLRFVFEIDYDTYALLSESERPKSADDTGIGFGTVLLSKTLLGTQTLTKETPDAVIVPAVKLFEQPTDVVKYTACLINTPEKDYTEEYVAVPYITYNDGGVEKTVYGEQTENVSIYNVAVLMYDDADVDTATKEYLYEKILTVVDPDYQK